MKAMTEKTKSKYLLLLECYSFGNSIKEVSLICNVSECLVGQSFSILKKEYNARNLVHLYKLVKIQKKMKSIYYVLFSVWLALLAVSCSQHDPKVKYNVTLFDGGSVVQQYLCDRKPFYSFGTYYIFPEGASLAVEWNGTIICEPVAK